MVTLLRLATLLSFSFFILGFSGIHGSGTTGGGIAVFGRDPIVRVLFPLLMIATGVLLVTIINAGQPGMRLENDKAGRPGNEPHWWIVTFALALLLITALLFARVLQLSHGR